jgi:hypothetical protein
MYVVVDVGGDTIEPIIIHVGFTSGQGRLCEGLVSSGSTANNVDHYTCGTNTEYDRQRIEKLGRGLAYTCCGCRTYIRGFEPVELCPARICDNAWCGDCWSTMRQIAEYSSTRFRVYCPCSTYLNFEGSEFPEDPKHLALDNAVFQVSWIFFT